MGPRRGISLKMLLSNLEYVSLRMLRRFVFRDAFLLRWGHLIPYYRANFNQSNPASLVSAYARHVSLDNVPKAILEIGVGATNSTGYEIAARNPEARITLLEPFVPLDAPADDALARRIAAHHACGEADLRSRVRRRQSLAGEAQGSFSLILSSSVLEHVDDPAKLFRELRRVISADGAMLHLVDYRDHFFKYPLHFLQFSRATWDRWLNPGDLPRWRLYDHVEALAAAGFATTVLETRAEPAQFAQISPRLSGDFRARDPHTAVTYAALLARPAR